MSKSLIALVGRPNVGKSTLFNRLVGERMSVVDDRPGTTRDRIQAPVDWRGVQFTLVDTGGIEPLETLRNKDQKVLAEGSADFIHEIREQAEAAINEADVIVFTCDAQVGLTGADSAVAEILRKLLGLRQKNGKTVPPVVVAASKAEALIPKNNSSEFYTLGLGEVFPVSGAHGDGCGDLLDAVVRAIPHEDPAPPDESIKIAIVGKPNAGKSSMFNQLIGEPRVIVSEVAGTTRDSVDTKIDFIEPSPDLNVPDSQVAIPITLIDTAGIRKRGSIEPGVEKYSVLRAFKSIERSDVALLMIDAMQGITAQDEHIAGYILDEHKSVVVCVNKWDSVESPEKVERSAKPVKGLGLLTEKMQEYLKLVTGRLNFMSYVPVLFVSAKTGFRCNEVLPTALRANEARSMRIQTADLNRIVREASEKHAPPSHGGRRLKIMYGSQVGTNPPTFLFHVNDKKLIHFSYERFLENRIRDEFGFLGTPIRISFRGRKEE